jgi:hypothetical protein
MLREGSVNPLRRSLLFACLTLALPACKKKPDPLKGSGVGATRARSVAAFSELSVGNGLEFEVTVGKGASLEISGDDNLISLVTTQVEGKRLTLGVDKKLKQRQPLRVRVGTERLDGIRVVAGAKGKVSGVRAEAFHVESGGGATVEIAGSSQALEVKSRSAARVDLKGFSAAKGIVTAADASTIELGYLEELDVTQTGMSRVIYRGEPKLTQSVKKPARLIRGD